MTLEELKKHGITICVNRRNWSVCTKQKIVASGRCNEKYDACNKARKEALDAAHVAFIKQRISPIPVKSLSEIWSSSLYEAIKKESWFKKFLSSLQSKK